MCKNKIEDKCCEKECSSKKAVKEPIKEVPVQFDMNRMKEAIAGEFIMMPSGLTKEEKRQFILSKAK